MAQATNSPPAVLAEILSNGAQGWAPDVRLRVVGDHYCVELLRVDTRHPESSNPVPVLYGRVVSCVAGGEPFQETHACMALSSKRLRGLLELGANVGDIVAVQVVGMSSGGTPLYRYGIKPAAEPRGREQKW